jgi:hypothetical protein
MTKEDYRPKTEEYRLKDHRVPLTIYISPKGEKGG